MASPAFPPKRDRNHKPEPLIWPPLMIAQRGAAGGAPGDPLASFKLALREGAEGIALDVQLTSDGVPVVVGDARLSRTTSGSGQAQRHPGIARLQLDAGAQLNRRFPSPTRRQHARSPLPLLSEVLQWVRDQQCMAFVAINNHTPGAEAKVLSEIGRAKVRNFTRVIANNMPGLRHLRQLDAKVHLGLRFAGRPPAVSHLKALGAEVLLPHWKATSPSFILHAHRARMLVIPWTVDGTRQMRRTILAGVDGIITNYPATLTETVANLQKTRGAVSS